VTECALRAGCAEITCTRTQCTSELSEAGVMDLLAASTLGSCDSARCSACAGDAMTEGDSGDARE